MDTNRTKIIVAAAWIAAVSVAGIVGDVNSGSSWAVLLAAGALPPIILWRWREPAQTMSESIQEARR